MMGRALVGALVVAWMATAGWSQSITWLGGDWSWASGVSADGAVVVGSSGRAFRWTASSGMQDLGTLGGCCSEAYGVSADGAVVVGWARNAAGLSRAFRWTASGGMQDLGTLPGGGGGAARGVSADGAVVVGSAVNAAGQRRAFRWTASGGMQDLGTLGGDWSVANGVSADGAVVVGVAENAAWQGRAFRWTASSGMQDLGTLGGYYYSEAYEAYDVSADGSVVVGVASYYDYFSGYYELAFRWTAEGGMEDLGTLGGDRSWAFGVSADGAVVVGGAYNAAGQQRAFRWTAEGGMEDLNITYACLLTDGSVLKGATAISPDGRYIVGQGYNAATNRNEAFLLDTRQGTPSLTLTPATATLPVGCTHTLTAALCLVPGVRVRFAVVEGVHAGVSGECVTGLNGLCSFSYVGERVGRDRIVAVAEVAGQVVQAEATVEWASLTWLGTLGGWESYYYSYASGVSADGSVVVGSSYAAGEYRAFRWTAAGGMEDLGTLGGGESWAYGVSADGAVVVGWARNAAVQDRAFRWTASGGMQDLGTLGGDWSGAYGVSADGAVVVGWAVNAEWQSLAFRWTASGGMQDLGTLPGGRYSGAYGVSADGAVVVGSAVNAAGQRRAFRWTAAGGMQDLGTMGYNHSWAYGVSADGSVVVGVASYYDYSSGYYERAFRWTASGGMQDLGTLPGGRYSEAYGVSADGSVVVGVSGGHAFRWTASGGMEDLNTTYARLLTNGSVLSVARAISPNGRFIVGDGYNAATERHEAFLLDTGFPLRGDVDRNGCVDDADLLQVLFAFGGRGYRNEDLNWDGTVDDADLLIVLLHFGNGC
jgi:probable HAF family extracellular repeat protein